MIPQFAADSPLLQSLWAAGLLISSVLVSWLVLLALKYIGLRLEKQNKAALIPQLLKCLSRPVFLLLLSQGLLLTLSSLPYLASWRPYLGKVAIAFVIIIVTYGLTLSGWLLMGWYMHRKKVRQSLIRMTQRIMIIIIYMAGLLVLLDYLGVSISPMVAGLGIGGLAVALALQPTLSNFFSGAQIVFDEMVRVGDYIELDTGEKGYVLSVGWRSTRVRTTFNNMMVIPNSRLVECIVTNYYGPDMELAVIVTSGVSYASDLIRVEEVAIEVAREIIEELPEAVKTREPWFAFDEFGDSNINFWVWLYATDRIGSFRVKSELIKRLHARFAREKITINYPVRLLTYEDSKDRKPSPPNEPPDVGI
ncbi:mechanosensitive ion channel family protein [Chloroflexota bacterium]